MIEGIEILRPVSRVADRSKAIYRVYVWERGFSAPRVHGVEISRADLESTLAEMRAAEDDAAQTRLF